MKLHVLERITLLQILPKEGSFATFKILIELKSALSFTEKEYKEFLIKEDIITNTIGWKSSKEKEITIGEKGKEIICNALKKLSEEEKLNEVTFNLYTKFVDRP